MQNPTAIPKLSSKNRYRATAAEVRLYGGKTVTDFFVMWDPADAATWTIERGYGKTPGARMNNARERAIARRALTSCDAGEVSTVRCEKLGPMHWRIHAPGRAAFDYWSYALEAHGVTYTETFTAALG